MVKPRKKRKRTRRKKAKPQWGWLKKSVLALFLMALGALFYALFFHAPWEQKQALSPPKTDSAKIPQSAKKRPAETPQPSLPEVPTQTYEIYPEKETAVDIEPFPSEPLSPSTLPRIAIIIDDLGQDKRMARKFLDLPGPLTFSVLPHLPHTHQVVEAVRAKRWEVMVHLPMEPNEYPQVNPGPGVLLSSMTPDALIAQLRKNLAAVPGAVGANNHMGSRLTAQSVRMNQVFSELKRYDLFFIDSRTSSDSVALDSARLFKVPFGQRHIFLDHHPNRQFIEKQLDKLQKKAQRHGVAIGIGHPYQITWQILSEVIPRLKEKVHLIPASQAVRVIP